MEKKALPRLLELDGLRGIAILSVLVFHYGNNPPFPGGGWSAGFRSAVDLGWPGVDLFFVLSGCLITGILLQTKGSEHYLKFFYMRRVLRILPLYYVAVAVFFWVYLPVVHAATARGLIAAPLGSWATASSWEQVWYWLHVSNWRSAFGVLEVSPVTHFWSLAIEEQFYLLWPFVVLAASERTLLKICGIGLAVSLLLRNVPYFDWEQSIHPGFLYRLTPFRMDGLLLGACIPLLARTPKVKQAVKRWSWALLAGALLAVTTACLYAGNTNVSSLPMARFGYSAIALIFFVLVFQAVEQAGSGTRYAALLRSAWLRRIGEISYGIYVIHEMIASPLEAVCRKMLPGEGVFILRGVVSILAGGALSYLLASLSWRLLEQPFLRLKRRFA